MTAVLVKAGDAVKAGQNVVDGRDGQGRRGSAGRGRRHSRGVHVKPGDKVPVGGVLLTLNGERSQRPRSRQRRRKPSRNELRMR